MTAPAPPPAPPDPTDRRERWAKLYYDRALATLSAAGFVIGGLWTLNGYLDQQRRDQQGRDAEQQQAADRRAVAAQAEVAVRDKEADLRRREINLMIYREKKEAYALLVDAAAEVATAKVRRDAEDRAAKYFGIYYGRAHIVPDLDGEVVDAKIAFAAALREYLKDGKDEPPGDALNAPLLRLAMACQQCLDCRAIDKKMTAAAGPPP